MRGWEALYLRIATECARSTEGPETCSAQSGSGMARMAASVHGAYGAADRAPPAPEGLGGKAHPRPAAAGCAQPQASCWQLVIGLRCSGLC